MRNINSVRCRNMVHYLLRSRSFHIGLLCGAISVLLDLDHIIAHYWLTGLDGRFLHTPILIGACTLIVIMCSCYSGLYIKLVLRRG